MEKQTKTAKVKEFVNIRQKGYEYILALRVELVKKKEKKYTKSNFEPQNWVGVGREP